MKPLRNTDSMPVYGILTLLVALALAPLHLAKGAPPTVAIELPAGPTTVFKGQSLVLKGHATDPITEKQIADQQLTWSSNHDGPLGKGPRVEVYLSAGAHTVSLTATNDKGEVTLATVVVTVEKR